MRRRTDLWFEPLGAPRMSRPQGYNLDLSPRAAAGNVPRAFGARPELPRAAVASDDGVTAVVRHVIQPRFGTGRRRLPVFGVHRVSAT